MDEPVGGGCFCGEIRYEIDEIFDVVYCHCTICRRLSGAPVTGFAVVPATGFRITAGKPRQRPSSEAFVRGFCANCGSPIFGRPAEGGSYVSVPTGCLDHPEDHPPTIHQCRSSRLPWFETTDGHPRIAENELPHPAKR